MFNESLKESSVFWMVLATRILNQTYCIVQSLKCSKFSDFCMIVWVFLIKFLLHKSRVLLVLQLCYTEITFCRKLLFSYSLSLEKELDFWQEVNLLYWKSVETYTNLANLQSLENQNLILLNDCLLNECLLKLIHTFEKVYSHLWVSLFV